MIDFYLDKPFPWAPCDLFKAGAMDTWERIRFSRNIPNLKIHETTITQNLIYEFRLLQLAGKVRGFLMQEARNERTNGADILLYLVIGGRTIGFAMQAKIIYHTSKKNHANGSYPQMHHEVKKSGKFQVDLIIDYASKEKLVPLYLMYNYVDPGFPVAMDMRYFGCSVVGAEFLSNKFRDGKGNLRKDIHFRSLHDHPRSVAKPAFPWHELVCADWAKSATSVLDHLGLSPSTELSSLPVDQLIRDDAFTEITDQLVLRNKEQRIVQKTHENKIAGLPQFNPKFRIFVDVDGAYDLGRSTIK